MVRPDRQHMVNALVIMRQHRVYHIRGTFLLQDGEQRMECPVGVPEREGCIVGEIAGCVDILIQSPLVSVGIHIDCGREESMV